MLPPPTVSGEAMRDRGCDGGRIAGDGPADAASTASNAPVVMILSMILDT